MQPKAQCRQIGAKISIRAPAVDAERIAKALGGRKAGATWLALCPAHDDRKPSLSIAYGRNGNIVVHCHAGCEQHQVLAELRARGLWEHSGQYRRNAFAEPAGVANLRDSLEQTRKRAAIHLWQETVASSGTLVETYLASRNIAIPVPDALRFHAAMKHPSGHRLPAMVALVTRGIDGAPVAVHRTFLACDGRNKAPIEPAKMMLGPCRGGAVRLGQVVDRLMIAEGIETALSAMQATRQPAWAALSTSGLRALELPTNVGDVVILADGDEPGESAAQDAGRRWKNEGRRVRVARPPHGFDFNDVLRGRAFCKVEDAA